MVFKHDGRRFVHFVTPLGKVLGEFRIVKLFVAFHFRLLDDFIVFINFYPQLDHTRIISLSRLKVKFFTPRFNSADTIAPPMGLHFVRNVILPLPSLCREGGGVADG